MKNKIDAGIESEGEDNDYVRIVSTGHNKAIDESSEEEGDRIY